MQQTIQISTPAHNGLYDITRQVEAIVAESGVQTGLSTWQNIFLCEFDGPRSTRSIMITILKSES